jgi:hypothetical protein
MYTIDDLRELLGLFQVHRKPIRKPELVDAVHREAEGDGLKQIWSRLDEFQQAAVSEVVHSTGTHHDDARFRAKYGRDPDWGAGSNAALYSYMDRRHFSLLHMFFKNNEMPADIKARLLEFVPEPAATTLNTLDAPGDAAAPMAVRNTEPFAASNVVSVMRLIKSGKVAVSDITRLPSSATVREIATVLSDGDFYSDANAEEEDLDGPDVGPIQAFAWPMILQSGGLAELYGKKLRLSPAGERALTKAPADVLGALWKKWLTNSLLDELRRIDVVKGQTGKGKKGLIAPRRRRELIVQTLADCPSGRWVGVEEFRRYMTATGRRLEVTRDPWALYIADPSYGSFGYLGYDFILDLRYLLCFLFEYAATLGLIDVAYIRPDRAECDYADLWGADDLDFLSRYDGLLFFRINALGAYCLGKTPTYGPQETEAPRAPRPRRTVEIIPLSEVSS